MAISRRQFVLSSVSVSGLALAGCSTNLSQYSGLPLGAVANRADICYAASVTLRAGVPAPVVVTEGCGPSGSAPADGILQAASLTKPVVAFAALELVRAGKLDLQVPVATYLPNGYRHRQKPFAGPQDTSADIVPAATLARIPLGSLLNHTSGLPNWTGGVLQPEFTPGERWQYSGEGYLLLQAVIEAVTGQRLDTVLQAQVFTPLGMRDSRLGLTDDIRARVIDSPGWLGGSKHYEMVEPNAAASLYTTAADYARWLAALAARPDLLALIVANPVPVDPALGLSWGYGWGIEEAEGGPYLWQWGNNPGYRAFAMLSLASRDGFVLMTNSEDGLRLLAPLMQSVVPAEHRLLGFSMLG